MATPNFFQRAINHSLPASRQSEFPEFNQTKAPGKKQGAEDKSQASTSPVFFTRESLVTFSGSTAAAYGVWTVIALLTNWKPSASPVLGYVLSLVICLFVCWQATSDPRLNDKTSDNYLTNHDKQVAYVISLLNSFQIFLATYGIVKATGV